ncbi:hypothetical protein FQA47_010432 [Oryzias melastigma]|uniref:Uncharacterized protein n=1 Tax=Oryzias melastigma TaxID=30732 RepID=A0A834C7J2_ORYME|nr:hypothetical protein FQA47_010432 [Oryzias melastigma]
MLKFDCLTSLRHLFLFGLAQDLRLHARQRGKMLACLQHHQHPSAGRVGPAVLMRRGRVKGKICRCRTYCNRSLFESSCRSAGSPAWSSDSPGKYSSETKPSTSKSGSNETIDPCLRVKQGGYRKGVPMSSGFEQNEKREEEESGRKERRRRMPGLHRGCSVRAVLPRMDAVVSLRPKVHGVPRNAAPQMPLSPQQDQDDWLESRDAK